MTEFPVPQLDDLGEPYLVKYWAFLGRFMARFAAVEAAMQFALWWFARVDADTAKAIFSGVKVEAGKDFINRLVEARPIATDLQEILAAVFLQLGIINQVRNDIIHFGAKFHPDGAGDAKIHVTNKRIALTESRLRETPITLADLNNMTYDLLMIETRLTVFRQLAGSPKTERDRFSSMRAPWRYKPLSQANGGRKKGQTPQARSPRR